MDLNELIKYSNELHIDYVDICEAAKKEYDEYSGTEVNYDEDSYLVGFMDGILWLKDNIDKY
jgi:hypothetical protein